MRPSGRDCETLPSLLHGEVDPGEGVGDEEADAEHELGRLLRQPRQEPRALRLKGETD